MLPGTTEPCASPQARGSAVASGPVPSEKSQARDPEASLTGLRPVAPYPADSVKFFPVGADFPWANTQAAQARARGTGDKAPAPPCCNAGGDCTEEGPAESIQSAPGAGKVLGPAQSDSQDRG